MLRVTIKKVNEQIKQHGYELVKGRGYFYFAALPDSNAGMLYSDSVHCYHLNDYTVEEWEKQLLEKVEESNLAYCR